MSSPPYFPLHLQESEDSEPWQSHSYMEPEFLSHFMEESLPLVENKYSHWTVTGAINKLLLC